MGILKNNSAKLTIFLQGANFSKSKALFLPSENKPSKN
jgi:hypothetical protein